MDNKINKKRIVETSLIILTRNEVEGLTSLIRKIPFETVSESFAVDFKSTDGTKKLLSKEGVRIVSQKYPGRGRAFQLAAKHAKGKYLIFFSPDGNENPSDIKKLIKKARQGNDLVIASRFMKGSRNEEDDKILKFRKWANQFFTFLANVVWGKGKISDSINGYRIIKKDLFNQLALDAGGFAIEYQMTIRSMKLGAQITEIPTIEGDRIGGESTAKAIPTGIRILMVFLRELFIGKNF